MLKLYGLLERRSDLTLAQFSEHWRTVHRELALRLVAPGIMRAYVQNHRRPEPVPGAMPPADGCPEVWIDSVDTLAKLATAPEYLEGAYPDEANFMEGPSTGVLTCTEATHGVARADAARLLKAMFFFRNSSDPWTPALAAWQTTASWLMPEARPVRLERDRCVPLGPGERIEPYAAIESTWWPDVAAFERAWAHRVTNLPWAGAFSIDAMLVEEVVVLLPASVV